MSDEIYGDRFLGRDKAAWHSKGNVFGLDEKKTVREAFDETDMLYQFKKIPLFYRDPETDAEIETGKVAIMRGPTKTDASWKQVGIADKDYGIIQHQQLADLLDSPIGEFGALSSRWPVETVGALYNGEVAFVTLRETPYDLKGDKVQRFFLVSDGKGGNHALHIAVVHLRVVCQNTLTAALNDAMVHVSFSHHANVADDMKLYTHLIASMENAQANITRIFSLLADAKCNDEQAKDVIAAAYPMRNQSQKGKLLEQYLANKGLVSLEEAERVKLEKAAQRDENRAERRIKWRDAAWERYQVLCQTNNRIAGTYWAVYNAVAEVEDNRKSRGEVDAWVDSVLWGERAQQRNDALSKAVELAGIK